MIRRKKTATRRAGNISRGRIATLDQREAQVEEIITAKVVTSEMTFDTRLTSVPVTALLRPAYIVVEKDISSPAPVREETQLHACRCR